MFSKCSVIIGYCFSVNLYVVGLQNSLQNILRILESSGKVLEFRVSNIVENLTYGWWCIYADVPYRPVGPIIVSKVSAHSMELEWRPPLGEGGSPVLGYVVEMTESGTGGQWVKVGYVSNRETRFTVAGLAEGASYFFRVFAENRAGLSRPLQSDCVTPTQPLGTSNSTFSLHHPTSSLPLSASLPHSRWVRRTLHSVHFTQSFATIYLRHFHPTARYVELYVQIKSNQIYLLAHKHTLQETINVKQNES